MKDGASIARACGRLTLLALHIQYGLLLITLCRYRYGKNWFDSSRGCEIIQGWSKRACDILAVRFQLRGTASIERDTLYVSNHVSWIDVIVLSSLIETKFLSKASVINWPLIGRLVVSTGTLFIKRDKRFTISNVIKNIRHKLAGQNAILIFPEGTTTDGRQLAQFHTGLFKSVADSRHFVQAVALRYIRDGQLDEMAPYVSDDNFIQHLFRIASLRETSITVAFAAPFQAFNMSRHAVSETARAEIMTLLEGHEDKQRAQNRLVA